MDTHKVFISHRGPDKTLRYLYEELMREFRPVVAPTATAMDEVEDLINGQQWTRSRISSSTAMVEVENSDIASMNRVARPQLDIRKKNKEIVTAPLEYEVVNLLFEGAFNIVDKVVPTSRALLTSLNHVHKVAFVVPQMQEHIYLEQCPNFQHSSQAYPLDLASLGNDNKVVGLQGSFAGLETQVLTKYRPHPANKSNGLPSKRPRSPDFEDKSKGLLLQAKLEYLQDPTNEEVHKWLVEKMRYNGHNQDLESLRGQREYLKRAQNLKKDLNAMSRLISQGTSYSDLTMDKKKAYKKDNDCHFPLTCECEWYDDMENIEKLDPISVSEEETRGDGQEEAFLLPFLLKGTGCLKEPGDESDSEFVAMEIPTDEEDSSVKSGASVESHTEIASADSHGPRSKPSRKRSAASAFDEESLFAKIRPFVNQQIEEALLPLISALRSREEDEHKHRQKMLALEREKLALMRQKLECTRRSNAVPASVAK